MSLMQKRMKFDVEHHNIDFEVRGAANIIGRVLN
jgi:hypothetical protein